MPTAAYGIRFRDGHVPMGVDNRGWLLDPMTDKPKRFGSNIAAKRYGELSFRYKYCGKPVYAVFDVVKLEGKD